MPVLSHRQGIVLRFVCLAEARVPLVRHCSAWIANFRRGAARLQETVDAISWRGVPEMGGWPRRRLPPIDWKREGWLAPPETTK